MNNYNNVHWFFDIIMSIGKLSLIFLLTWYGALHTSLLLYSLTGAEKSFFFIIDFVLFFITFGSYISNEFSVCFDKNCNKYFIEKYEKFLPPHIHIFTIFTVCVLVMLYILAVNNSPLGKPIYLYMFNLISFLNL